MTLSRLQWVKLNKYCELSGDTPSAVRNRRRRGVWLDGKQSKCAPDGNLWVNLGAVEQWVEQSQNSSAVLRQKPAKALPFVIGKIPPPYE